MADSVEFKAALKTARTRLRAAESELKRAQANVARLNSEIPRLQRTVMALTAQVDPKKDTEPITFPRPQLLTGPSDELQLRVREVTSEMGSIPANVPATVEGAQTPEELPGMDEDFV